MLKLFSKVRSSAAVVALAIIGALLFPSISHAQVTLPDPGVDVGGHITALITALGAVVAVAVGGYFAFLLIRKALGWGRKAT